MVRKVFKKVTSEQSTREWAESTRKPPQRDLSARRSEAGVYLAGAENGFLHSSHRLLMKERASRQESGGEAEALGETA